MARIATPTRTTADIERIEIVRRQAEPLAPPPARDFAAPFDRFGGARLVLLGEATHGTAEFYRARAEISRRLIEKHRFTIVAAEADWPDAARIDRYVRHLAPEPSKEQAFARFPTWMWRNQEFREFVEWLREYNGELDESSRVEFRGLDVYSLSASIEAVLRYLDRVDPEEARRARGRYGCLTPWQHDPAAYGAAALKGRVDCEPEVLTELQSLLAHRLDYEARDSGFFDAVQNARIVRAAEEYYRVMYHGSAASWNLRDRHMFDTLTRVIDARGEDARAIVWAHNSHIGNAAATAMGWQGEFNIGELCRVAYGDEAILIGFGTDRGRVAAARAWDESMQIMNVLPARSDSYEALFREAGVARSLTDWRPIERGDLRDALRDPRLERAIGVIYRSDSELTSHYFKAVLPEQFDAYVWFEETDAITPFGPAVAEDLPETYPFGV